MFDPRCRARRLWARLGPVLAAVAALLILGRAPQTEAKLQPYYILNATSFGEITPRILFVLDSSNSMKRAASTGVPFCIWNECEAGDPATESRMSAARRAMRQVVTSTQDKAQFSVMTFEQHLPPTIVPPKCTYDLAGGGSEARRFAWLTSVTTNGQTQTINHYPGYTGSWALCDGSTNRPYPYLRWDELGLGSAIAGDDQTGAVPASPLVSTAQADMHSEFNAKRRVQWFPKFLGVRAQLNATTDPDQTILAGSIGDYATDETGRLAEVWEQDYYYWPYVDGFVGYTTWRGNIGDANYHETTANPGSVSGNRTFFGHLYSPFYMDLSSTTVPPANWGPADEAASLDATLSLLSPLIEGGIDPHSSGITPWKTTVGAIPADADVPQDNSEFSHNTVASYLKFVTTVGDGSLCTPTSVVLVTDGFPAPSSEGGAPLYERLEALRKELGVKTYVVGMFQATAGQLNNMACAAAGACDGTCSTPCDDTPSQDWDTCADPDNPGTSCAFLANSAEELAAVLSAIIKEQLALDLPSGPKETVNEFGIGASGQPGEGDTVQTNLTAFTDWPGWQGHVVRSLCDETDDANNPQPWCDPALAGNFDDVDHAFGPCPRSRTWDAGECLQQTAWADRRLYTNNAAGQVIPILDAGSTASAGFTAELTTLGLVSGADAQAQADAMAQFIAGKDWPSAWKLPGLANAAPVVVRRIPRFDPKFSPSVPIRDPHCAGRILSEGQDVPPQLQDFAQDAWDQNAKLPAPAEHYEYQEAVLIGDDLGVMHAFQLDSGNELWGYLPRFALAGAAQQAAIGALSVGQPEELEDHNYGIAATVNQGWVWDDTNNTWRHLAVFGQGAGGTRFVALDVAHMSPQSPDGPFEVLWTSDDIPEHVLANGETWARPSLSYQVPGNTIGNLPVAKLVVGSGYATDPATSKWQGRVVLQLDALTGTLDEFAILPVPAAGTIYEPNFGAVVDPTIASHCISRFWAEMQEVYIADPAGRLFRWDLGGNHVADSVTTWNGNAQQVVRFGACQGTTDTCSVATGAAAMGDVFTFAPAVTGLDRIDAVDAGGISGTPPDSVDEFLVALVSGSPFDDSIDAGQDGADFHSSLYLLVDDHSSGDHSAGFDIPADAPKMTAAQVGTDSNYLRIALTDLERTRQYTPYDGSATYSETRNFSRATRPIRAPRIFVRGVLVDDGGVETVADEVEVFEITYTVHEPGANDECDSQWFDPTAKQWHFDEGSTYELAFRLTASTTSGFDFQNGAGDEYDFGAGMGGGLELVEVRQVRDGGCADGVCGPKDSSKAPTPCDNNADAPAPPGEFAIPIRTSEILGFTPME